MVCIHTVRVAALHVRVRGPDSLLGTTGQPLETLMFAVIRPQWAMIRSQDEVDHDDQSLIGVLRQSVHPGSSTTEACTGSAQQGSMTIPRAPLRVFDVLMS